MKCILTSRLDIYYKDESGNKIAKNFGNQNKILDNIKKYVKNYENFLFVSNDGYGGKMTDAYADIIFKSLT